MVTHIKLLDEGCVFDGENDPIMWQTVSYHCALYQEGINPTLLENKVIPSRVRKELQNEAHKAAQRKLNNKD